MQSMDPNMQQMIVPGDMSSSIILASMAAAATEQGFAENCLPNEQDPLESCPSNEQGYVMSRAEHSALQQRGPSITHACGNFHTPSGCSIGFLVKSISDYFRSVACLLALVDTCAACVMPTRAGIASGSSRPTFLAVYSI